GPTGVSITAAWTGSTASVPDPEAAHHLLERLARDAEPLRRARLAAGRLDRVDDHLALERVDGGVQRADAPRARRGGRRRARAAPLLGAHRRGPRLGVAGERDRALDLVLELADVAAPGVGDEAVHRLVAEALELARHRAVREVEEVVREQRDVLAALA